MLAGRIHTIGECLIGSLTGGNKYETFKLLMGTNVMYRLADVDSFQKHTVQKVPNHYKTTCRSCNQLECIVGVQGCRGKVVEGCSGKKRRFPRRRKKSGYNLAGGDRVDFYRRSDKRKEIAGYSSMST